MKIYKQPHGKYIYAFEFNYLREVVERLQKLKDDPNGSDLVYKANAWRFTDLAWVNKIKNELWEYQIDVSEDIEKDFKAYSSRKEDEFERLNRIYTLKNTLESDYQINHIKGEPWPFQRVGVEFIEAAGGRCIIADEMGCLTGDTEIGVNRAGCHRIYKLEDLYKKFHSERWKNGIVSRTRSMGEDGRFYLNDIEDVIDSGLKEVYLLTATTGEKEYQIKLTANHRLITPDGEWVEAQNICVGGKILVNGKFACHKCETTENLITYKYSKFIGWCKKCMYRYGRSNKWKGNDQHKDKDGYIRVSNVYEHPNCDSNGIVPQHVLVVEADINNITYDEWINLARYGGITKRHHLVDKKKMCVHHKNEIKDDNRIENLELMSKKEHSFYHSNESRVHLPHVLPEIATITSFEKTGIEQVYDICMKGPNNNFIASGIVVHNSGKTMQSLCYFAHNELNKMVVVCPAIAKGVWYNETLKWTNLRPYIIEGKTDLTMDIWQNHDVFIINYDIIGARAVKKNSKIKRNKFCDFFNNVKIDLLIADECHRAKNVKAARTQSLIALSRNIDRFIGLSGTPLLNRPLELFTTLNIIDPQEWNNPYEFIKRYCQSGDGKKKTVYTKDKKTGKAKKIKVLDRSGASNIDELRRRIGGYFLRRTKDQILPFLPKKVETTIDIDLDPKSAKLYKEIEREFIDSVNEDRESLSGGVTVLNELRQISSLGKVEAVIEFIEDLKDSQKVIVFSSFNEPLRQIRDYFGEECVYVTGETNADQKTALAKKFCEDESVRIFLGGTISAGESLTLVEARSTIFIDYPWVPGQKDQASDRNHRPGAEKFHDSLNIYQMHAKGTVDDPMRGIIYNKRKIFDALFSKDQDKAEKSAKQAIIDSYKKRS